MPVAKELPPNAYTPLPPDTAYQPVVPASAQIPELTTRSVAWGAFPVRRFHRRFRLLRPQSGASHGSGDSHFHSGHRLGAPLRAALHPAGECHHYRHRRGGGRRGGGRHLTLPALYILKLEPHPLETIFICLAGGCLGVLFLIPLRRYFVREMHGRFPFPEATAITEVLVTGEKGGSQARLLLEATAIAGVYDFLVTTFHVWKEYLDFQFVPVVRLLSERAKTVFNFDAIGFILGLGYVMGLRSSLILCAGGVLSNFVLAPLIWMIGRHLPDFAVYPAQTPIAQMTAAQIFRGYVRFVGVGAIATAGIFGVLKSLRIIAGSFGVAMHAFRRGEAVSSERTDRDVSPDRDPDRRGGERSGRGDYASPPAPPIPSTARAATASPPDDRAAPTARKATRSSGVSRRTRLLAARRAARRPRSLEAQSGPVGSGWTCGPPPAACCSFIFLFARPPCRPCWRTRGLLAWLALSWASASSGIWHQSLFFSI